MSGGPSTKMVTDRHPRPARRPRRGLSRRPSALVLVSNDLGWVDARWAHGVVQSMTYGIGELSKTRQSRRGSPVESWPAQDIGLHDETLAFRSRCELVLAFERVSSGVEPLQLLLRTNRGLSGEISWVPNCILNARRGADRPDGDVRAGALPDRDSVKDARVRALKHSTYSGNANAVRALPDGTRRCWRPSTI
jgi:hypothetical protein